MSRYLIVAGPRAAGKDTFADYAESSYGFVTVRGGGLIADIIGLSAAERSEKRALIEAVGRITADPALQERYFAAVIERLGPGPGALIGPRQRWATDGLVERLGDVPIIGITADADIRYARTSVIGAARSREEFDQLDANSIGADLPTILAQARATIRNEGDLTGFYRSIDLVLTSLSFIPAPRATPAL